MTVLTDRKSEANRRNALLSCGPVSADGKLRSSANATKHGLTARRRVLLPDESAKDFGLLLKQYAEEFAPVGRVEQDLVEQLAIIRWRLLRAQGIERDLIAGLSFDSQDVNRGAAFAFVSDSNQVGALDKLLKYEGQLERRYFKYLHEIERFQRRRLGDNIPPPLVIQMEGGGEV